MGCFSEELNYRLKLNNFIRCECKDHTYEIWECRWIKPEYFKCLDHFSESVFWKALRKKDYRLLAFLTKSENLFSDSIIEIKNYYKLEENGKPEDKSLIWDSDPEKDYSVLFNWYYKMNINIVFVDVNTNLNKCDPKYVAFLKKNKFPFFDKLF